MKPVKAKDVRWAYCDGDIWCYRIANSVQHAPTEPKAPWFTVQWKIDETIEKVQRKYPNAKIVICLTDEKQNYREGIAVTKPYKGGRSLTKPYYWRKIRDTFLAMDNVLLSVNEEADDVMSYMNLENMAKSVIVTEDKDLKNTAGLHWNDKTGAELWVTPAMANRNFYKQLLTGDGVDNIAGCPNVGSLSPWMDVLDGCKTIEEYECVVGLAYACASRGEDTVPDPESRMIEMGQLLWMRRERDQMWNLHANGFRSI